MTSTEYQRLSARTDIEGPNKVFAKDELMLVWYAIGLSGEAGEIADHVKKGVFHEHGIDREKLILEMGDVCWYLAAMCRRIGTTLPEVMAQNIAKLQARYPDGFDVERSRNRGA
jgi:NTP pyrophosphatase (non-canonical NTP hydrolase)